MLPAGPSFFEADGVEVGYRDFERALATLGVREGDILCVHSDIATFGKLLVDDRSFVMERICRSLVDAVGSSGSVIMPTFTYSFCNGEVFDVGNSRSTVGALTEYFRLRPDAIRTKHPLFSVAIWGHDKEWFLDVGRDSFDEDSIFGKLHARNAKILLLGVPFRLACTYVHYIEQRHAVPYRYLKEFKGIVKIGGQEIPTSCTYNVRYLDRNINTDLSRFEVRLLGSGIMRSDRIGCGDVQIVEAEALFEDGRRLLDQDIYGFLERKGSHAVSVLREH